MRTISIRPSTLNSWKTLTTLSSLSSMWRACRVRKCWLNWQELTPKISSSKTQSWRVSKILQPNNLKQPNMPISQTNWAKISLGRPRWRQWQPKLVLKRVPQLIMGRASLKRLTAVGVVPSTKCQVSKQLRTRCDTCWLSLRISRRRSCREMFSIAPNFSRRSKNCTPTTCWWQTRSRS